MTDNTSNLRIYGPKLPEAIVKLETLTQQIDELPISEGKIQLGKYDFQFIWKQDPTPQQLLSLIEKIDETLTNLPTKYSITTEGPHTNRLTAEFTRNAINTIYSFIRIHGPSISKAVRAIEAVVDTIETTNILPSLKSSILIGKYDFAFEWDHWPTNKEIYSVLTAIDKQVAPTGALYTITTKKNIVRTETLIDDHSSDNLMAFL